jgi:hypothetical protein
MAEFQKFVIALLNLSEGATTSHPSELSVRSLSDRASLQIVMVGKWHENL